MTSAKDLVERKKRQRLEMVMVTPEPSDEPVKKKKKKRKSESDATSPDVAVDGGKENRKDRKKTTPKTEQIESGDVETQVVKKKKKKKHKSSESEEQEHLIDEDKTANNDESAEKVKKKSKKKKDTSDKTEVDQNSSEKDDGEAVESEQTPSKKKPKKSKKKKEKESETDESKSASESALEYLRSWKNERRQWRFQKVRQVWLLQNMYKKLISDEDFGVLLEYMEALKGAARQKTIDQADDIIKKAEDSDNETETTADSNSSLVERARQVLQMLS